jgi:hypothetical protein
LSEDGAAVVRRMSGDASEKSDVTSESMPPNATNLPGDGFSVLVEMFLPNYQESNRLHMPFSALIDILIMFRH